MSSNSETPTVPKKGKNGIFSFLGKIFKGKQSSFEESVSELIKEHHGDTSVHNEEKVILQNIVTFGDREVKDVMVPRTDIIAVPDDIKIEELKKRFIDVGHSRIPVYKESIDEIQGFIHLKDFFKILISKKKFDIKEIIRSMLFVPGTMKVTDLLSKMKESNNHIAIVLDEYGGTDGLVTIEDIVEEVVGEIHDEYEETNQMANFISTDQDGFIVDAKAKIEAVESRIGINFGEKSGEYDTIGGLVITCFGRIPNVGEKYSHPKGVEIEVLDADNRKVKMLKLSFPDSLRV